MAKGNLFQGQARGKVGDVVFSRLNGQQISRVRNRNPKNPKSTPQQYQRAVMATVMAMYAAGKSIYNHSFQGKSVGAANQRYFLKENARLLRAMLVDDLNSNRVGVACRGRFTAPGVNTPVPSVGYKISEGTYNNNIFTSILESVNLFSGQNTQTLTTWLAAAGENFKTNDIFTFVIVGAANTSDVRAQVGDNDYQKVYGSAFYYLQLKVKDLTALSSATLAKTLSTVTFADLFDIVNNTGFDFDSTNVITTGLSSGDDLPFEGNTYVEGIIRSREDADLRSTSYLQAPPVSGWTADWGLSSDVVMDAWAAGVTAVGNSDLILEGVNFTAAG